MIDRQQVLHLSLIKGIGPSTIQKIVERWAALYAASGKNIYSCTVTDFISIGVSIELSHELVSGLKDHTLLQAELLLIEKYNASYCTIIDEQYQEKLKEIHAPPAVIYWLGQLPISKKSIAFVGSRGANHYAQRIIDQLVPPLVMHDCTIVSGGAIGADSMAHYATLAAGGKTIVVLGSGLSKLYPYRNRKLYTDIIKMGGAIVSPFPMSAEPYPSHFVARNRVIAGLSDGVVVVQAAQKSGTRITAQFALEQGRDVFAVPGSIEDPLSAGCHALIKEGAKITSSAEDILEEYGLAAIDESHPQAVQQSIAFTRHSYPHDSVQSCIISSCATAQSADDLAAVTNKELSEIQSLLFELQLEGAVEQDFTGLWKAT